LANEALQGMPALRLPLKMPCAPAGKQEETISRSFGEGKRNPFFWPRNSASDQKIFAKIALELNKVRSQEKK